MELGGRAFDVLVALIEANGAVVGKDELMNRVWPGRIVEDNNLHAQVKALRKAFSDRTLFGPSSVAATSSRARSARAVPARARGRSRGRRRKFPAHRALRQTFRHRHRI
jgi:hypothetical protein